MSSSDKKLPDPIKGVDKNEVGTTVQDFIDDDVKQLSVSQQDDKTYTVTPEQ